MIGLVRSLVEFGNVEADRLDRQAQQLEDRAKKMRDAALILREATGHVSQYVSNPGVPLKPNQGNVLKWPVPDHFKGMRGIG